MARNVSNFKGSRSAGHVRPRRVRRRLDLPLNPLRRGAEVQRPQADKRPGADIHFVDQATSADRKIRIGSHFKHEVAMSSTLNGGPAPRLSLAPEAIRCKGQIRRRDGGVERCSRFTIFGVDGQREELCVGHSRSSHAEDLRTKARAAQEEAAAQALAARDALAKRLFPAVWDSRTSIQKARHALAHALLRNELALSEFSALRALLADAERPLRSQAYDWLAH